MQLYMTLLVYEMLTAMLTFTHLCAVIDTYYAKLNAYRADLVAKMPNLPMGVELKTSQSVEQFSAT